MDTITPVIANTTAKTYSIERIEPNISKFYSFVKRFFDLFVSIFTLAVLLLPLLIISIIIRLDSTGPAFFRQERLGMNGKAFTIYKFRTMKLNAEKLGPQWAKENDTRCTKVGRFLRKTRLDELPQLINVIKGDMSIVGPRPEREYFYDEFEKYIFGFRNRLAVRPGITGLAQVNGGYDLKPEEKIIYDMEYISKISLKLDLHCIIKTVSIIFTHDGAR